MFSWDDIGVFLALYRERTTGRAANARGVSQPTIVRRIAALENDLGLALFERSPTGLMPTDAAHGLYASAQRIERSVCEFTAEVDGLTGAEVNLIRLTFLDHFEQLLIPVLRDFRSRWPRVQTQLLASDHIYDLARGEADIGVRGRDRPTSDELIVRQLPPSGWTIYASAHSSAEERPRAPRTLPDIRLRWSGASPRPSRSICGLKSLRRLVLLPRGATIIGRSNRLSLPDRFCRRCPAQSGMAIRIWFGAFLHSKNGMCRFILSDGVRSCVGLRRAICSIRSPRISIAIRNC
ncbi:LysR family transcriptional regulator [Sphingomonas sediminicola]|uniref:LysR family transcriptional regulator n=1 Tax=Sphingomonas sediminicola TaxID=386874 RepID=A0ABX6TDB6_9SPHN|nr:LysR family transcriptional regulator [Sphingomonas sediminicola]QNP46748.1 LysR family transcriptional regulator [Sphingomonas sediminicola]